MTAQPLERSRTSGKVKPALQVFFQSRYEIVTSVGLWGACTVSMSAWLAANTQGLGEFCSNF